MEAKTLHLNLMRQWFDMTLSGIKKEEYRAITPYWIKRLLNHDFAVMCMDAEDIEHAISCNANVFKKFEQITSRNGYATAAPEFTIEHLGVEIREGNPEWGAVAGVKYFVLKHGKIVSTKNIKDEHTTILP